MNVSDDALREQILQPLFDRAATHLLLQRGRCYEHPSGVIVWCNDRGEKSAIGCLLAYYVPEMAEANTWEELLANARGCCSYVERMAHLLDVPLLRDLVHYQWLAVDSLVRRLESIHDNVDVEIWIPSLWILAHRLKLSISVLIPFLQNDYER